MKKIVYGICGIGNGHLYRQLPLMEKLLLEGDQILIFTYGSALDYLNNKYHNNPMMKIVEVWVPYYVGNKTGLDFIKTAAVNKEHAHKYILNFEAFKIAQEWIGKPDLVISDYEPNAAQYGYSVGSYVVTLDQQSKYLLETFPKELNGHSYQDEIARLNMFFPQATARIACSFFAVPENTEKSIMIVPPILRPGIVAIKKNKDNKSNSNKKYIVYLTAQHGYLQDISEIMVILNKVAKEKAIKFSVFLPKEHFQTAFACGQSKNINVYEHGSKVFEQELSNCLGIVSTAGHSLLSEAMYLGIPVYALPLPLYEQQLNAYIINQYGFGIQGSAITYDLLEYFISNNSIWKENIQNDTSILLKGNGLKETYRIIENIWD
jgi:uncharacterized protein (TIGR00661 family)